MSRPIFFGLAVLLASWQPGCARRVSDADIKSATLRFSSVNYFGGMTESVDLTFNKAKYRRTMGLGSKAPAQTGTVELNEAQQKKFQDLINMIVRNELWKQKDVKVAASDGGEREFEFQVGKHKGQFKLINASPEDLIDFLTKASELRTSVREQVEARQQTEKTGPRAPSASKLPQESAATKCPAR